MVLYQKFTQATFVSSCTTLTNCCHDYGRRVLCWSGPILIKRHGWRDKLSDLISFCLPLCICLHDHNNFITWLAVDISTIYACSTVYSFILIQSPVRPSTILSLSVETQTYRGSLHRKAALLMPLSFIKSIMSQLGLRLGFLQKMTAFFNSMQQFCPNLFSFIYMPRCPVQH